MIAFATLIVAIMNQNNKK
ncbi:hypothetical protein [Streptococcus gallinaceus]